MERGPGECAGATLLPALTGERWLRSSATIKMIGRASEHAAGSSHTRTPTVVVESAVVRSCATRRRRMGRSGALRPARPRAAGASRAFHACVYHRQVLMLCAVTGLRSVERVCGCAPDARPWVAVLHEYVSRCRLSRVAAPGAGAARRSRRCAFPAAPRAAAPRPETDARWKESRAVSILASGMHKEI